MNSKTTGIWFALAAMLAAFIFIFQHYFQPVIGGAAKILPGLQLASVTSIQIIPSGALEIRAERTNDSWLLSKPVSYPAQSAAIETLLDALQKLSPASKISAAQLREHKNSGIEFGFDSPQTSLVIEAGDKSWQLKIGNHTAPGDQVYLRVVGTDGAFVADADWLKSIPRSATDWRSTALVDAGQDGFDSIILTNGAKAIELHRDATNHLWRMTRPLQTRANNELITDALQHLKNASVSQFVTDDPKADLASFGLQPADLDLWLGRGTNFSAAIHAGKNPTNDATLIYAKREGWDAVVTVPEESLSSWHATVNDFRDPHLLELTAPVAEIEVRGRNNFTLQRQGTNDWSIAGEKFSGDAASIQQFIKTLAGLRVADFVKDVGTAPDLQAYGLDAPALQINLLSVAGDTNSVIARLAFAAQTNGIFVRRMDEDSIYYTIYSIAPEDFNRLPEEDWEFRDRQIWHFEPEDVAQITLHQDGKTVVMAHNSPNKWAITAGSDIINGKYIEDTTRALSDLTAFSWVGRNVTEPEKFGLDTNNLQIVFEMKNGEKHSVAFGTEYPKWQSALAAVTLDGERWAFLFPPGLYQFVLSYLTIPVTQRGTL